MRIGEAAAGATTRESAGAQTFPIVLNKKNFTEINFHEALRTWTFLSGFHMPIL